MASTSAAAVRGNDAEPTCILPHLFLGSKVHARDRALLTRLEITHVLNVTPPKSVDPVAGVPNYFEKDKALTYRRCAIFDNKAEDISGVLEGCIAFIDQAKYYGRILVHCSKGVSRSTSMVVAYLMKLEQLHFAAALARVVALRPIANPNASFQRQLIAYDAKLERAATLAAAKNNNNSSRRLVRGPQRPPQPDDNEDDVVDSATPPNAAIGPQLPPHLQQRKATATDSSDTFANATNADSAATIGPQLPPHLQATRKRERDSDGDNESTSKRMNNSSDA